MIVFTDDNSGKAKKVIVSVKGGHVNVSQIRDLGHVDRPRKRRNRCFPHARTANQTNAGGSRRKRLLPLSRLEQRLSALQILTVEDLLAGKTVDLPPNLQTYKQAGRVTGESKDQGMLGFE